MPQKKKKDAVENFEKLVQDFFGKQKDENLSYQQYFSTLENPENDPDKTKVYHPKIESLKKIMFLLEEIKSLLIGEGAEEQGLIDESQNSNHDSIIRINELNLSQQSEIPHNKQEEEFSISVLQMLDHIYKEKNQMNQSETCQALCFNKDDTLIATAKRNEIIIWTFQEGIMNKNNGKEMRHTGEISCLLFDKDSDILISGGGDYDRQIKIWERTEQMKWELKKETQKLDGGIKVMLLNKKKDKLFIGTQKGQIAIFEVNFTTFTLGQPKIQQINETQKPIFGLSLNENENYLVSCGMDCCLRLFSIDQEIKQLQIEKRKSFGMRIKFIDNSDFVLNQRNGKLIYYKIEENKLLSQQPEFDLSSGISDHIFTPIWYNPNRNLLIVKHNKVIHFLKLVDGKFEKIDELDYKYYLLFATVSNSGRFLVTWAGEEEKKQNQGEKQQNQDEKHGLYQIYELNYQ